jgi:cytochrome c oxidase accessory protein FixG
MSDTATERPPAVRRRALPIVQEQASSLATDGKRNFVYPADVKGRFARARKAVFVVLIAVYAALPWITIGGHPAVFLDVDRREFFLFGGVFNAQDAWMTVFLFTGSAFGLVVLTAVAGRVWCGWACPQTVFLDGVYRSLERVIEGSREKRMRRDQGPWTWDKLWRKCILHASWVAVSLALAHVCLAYFVSLRQVFDLVRHRPTEHLELFVGVTAFASVLYFNFAWFREQFCVVLCPYGRLQSVLLDGDSLVVGYDATRGEPRGKANEPGAADCVDCKRCVVVCPTGIDIRNGLQMDCIACTACIDACDDVMDRLDRPRGLIRYDSQNGLAGKERRLIRPRMYVYAALGAAGITAAGFAFGKRVDVEANMLRVTGAPYVLEGDRVRNALHVHLVNKRAETTTFEIEPVKVAANVDFLLPIRSVTLAPLGSVDLPLFASVARADYHGEFPVSVVLRPKSAGKPVIVTAPFLGPEAR